MSAIRYLRTNFDELSILSSLLYIQGLGSPSESYDAVLSAFRRYSGETQTATEVANYLDGLSEHQVPGVVSAIKGILHEMEFVRLENADGDSITASMYSDPNNEGFDVLMTEDSTGATYELQLKATDDVGYVQDWIDDHPDGEIVVTSEIAEKMGLNSSGISNEDITVQVEDFVDAMLQSGSEVEIVSLVPVLGILSVSLVVWELYGRYRDGKITFDQFRDSAISATGIKAAKFGILVIALSLPVVNVATGAALVAKLIYSAAGDQVSDAKSPPRQRPVPVLGAGGG